MNISSALGMHLFPLQVQVQDFWKSKSASKNDALYFVIGIAAIVIVLIIVNIVKKKYPGAATGATQVSAGGGGGPRHFSGFVLHRLANNIGLDRDQIKMLEYVFKSDGVTDVERSLNSPPLLDRHFKRAYRLIERTAGTDEEAQTRLAVLFSTRNIIESNAGGGGLSSTRQVPENSSAVLAVDKESYPVRVLSTKGEILTVENPKNPLGSPLKLPRGSKVSLSFFTKSSKGFSFESRIVGNATSEEGGPVLQLAHSSQLKRLSQRRFRRRQTTITADFYLVYVEEGRKEKKLVVDKRRLSGNILDISVGGCSVKTNVPVNSGVRLKIEFTQDDATVAVLGQVLRTNRTGTSTIMHIKFLKVPRRSMNAINALVYEYIDD